MSLAGLVSKNELYCAIFSKEKHMRLDADYYVLRACQYLLSRQLKSMCYANGREKDEKQSAYVISQLAMVYRFRSPDKLSLIKSAALFNSATEREGDSMEETDRRLAELCSHVLKLAGAGETNFKDRVDMFFKSVMDMRDSVSDQLAALPRQDSHENVGLEKRESETKYSKQVSEIQTYVTQKYLSIQRNIMEYSIQLKCIPPCKYALVGMGSLARNEITPYSDFESIIVLEEGVQLREDYEEILEYFRWAAVIFQLVLVNFGETIIPFLYIEGLNDPYKKEDNWFYDEHTCCGICPDGFAPHASKNPLGRQKTKQKSWLTELIKPVGEMLKYVEMSEDVKNGYNLADILLKTCFVQGNLEVFKDFSAGVTGYRSQMSSSRHFMQEFEKTLEKFDTTIRRPTVDSKFDLKRLFFRGISLLLSLLGRYFELKTLSPLDTVVELEQKSIIGMEFGHSLKVAISVASEARLKMYMHTGGQDDELFWDTYRFYDEGSGLAKEVTVDRLAAFLQAFDELKTFVKKDVLKISDSECDEQIELKSTKPLSDRRPNFRLVYYEAFGMHEEAVKECSACLSNFTFLSDGRDWFEMTLVTELCQLKKYQEAYEQCQIFLQTNRKKEMLYIAAECLMELSRYAEALVLLEKCLAMFPANNDDEMVKSECLGRVGECLFHLNLYAPALKYIQECQSISDKDPIDEMIAQLLFVSGKSLFHLGQIKKALETFFQLLEIQKRLTENETEDYEIATTLNFVHLCLIQLDRWHEADNCKFEELAIYKNVVRKYEEIPDDETWIPDAMIKAGLNIYECLKYFERNDEYVGCLEDAYRNIDKSCKQLYNEEKLDNVRRLRKCLVGAHDFMKASNMFKLEVEVLKNLRDDEIYKFDIVECYLSHGKLLEMRRRKLAAFELYKQGISTMKFALETTHFPVKVMHKMGLCYMALGQYSDALVAFKRQLDEAHKEISSYGNLEIFSLLQDKVLSECYRNIASALHKKGDYYQSLYYYNLEIGLRKRISTSCQLPVSLADCLTHTGICHFDAFQFDDAIRCFQESIEICDAAPVSTLSSTMRFSSRVGIAKCLSKIGNYKETASICKQAIGGLTNTCQDRNIKRGLEFCVQELERCTTPSAERKCVKSHRNKLLTSLNEIEHRNVIECIDLLEIALT